MKRTILILALCAVACGDADDTRVDDTGSVAAIQLASQIEAATTKITVRIFAPRDREKVIVTCTSLLSGNPVNDRYELLQSATFAYPPSDASALTVSNVKSDEGAVVYVDARNAADQVIGEGCEDGVNVKGGSTATVNITVYPAS